MARLPLLGPSSTVPGATNWALLPSPSLVWVANGAHLMPSVTLEAGTVLGMVVGVAVGLAVDSASGTAVSSSVGMAVDTAMGTEDCWAVGTGLRVSSTSGRAGGLC